VKPPPFDYAAPDTVDEAVSLLKEHGDEAKVLAGGQSLVPLMALRLARPSVVVDLGRVAELRYVRHSDDIVRIGAMTTHRDIELDGFLQDRSPMIREAMSVLGHVAIRNRGTVGGSCAHSDPAAEWPALALVLDAEFEASGPGGQRTIAAADFFQSYFTTALEPEEVLTEIRLPLPERGTGSAFEEFSRRHGDFGIVGSAAVVHRSGGVISDARVALVGVGGTPVRSEAAAMMIGSDGGDDVLDAIGVALQDEIDPTGDIHGSSEFRRHCAALIMKRAMRLAVDRAEDGGR
jgi:carbon-monoxide dehydrogenase medium subunit